MSIVSKFLDIRSAALRTASSQVFACQLVVCGTTKRRMRLGRRDNCPQGLSDADLRMYVCVEMSVSYKVIGCDEYFGNGGCRNIWLS